MNSAEDSGSRGSPQGCRPMTNTPVDEFAEPLAKVVLRGCSSVLHERWHRVNCAHHGDLLPHEAKDRPRIR